MDDPRLQNDEIERLLELYPTIYTREALLSVINYSPPLTALDFSNFNKPSEQEIINRILEKRTIRFN